MNKSQFTTSLLSDDNINKIVRIIIYTKDLPYSKHDKLFEYTKNTIRLYIADLNFVKPFYSGDDVLYVNNFIINKFTDHIILSSNVTEYNKRKRIQTVTRLQPINDSLYYESGEVKKIKKNISTDKDIKFSRLNF